MFLLHLGHFAGVMSFAGSEDDEETGEGEEREQAEHARQK